MTASPPSTPTSWFRLGAIACAFLLTMGVNGCASSAGAKTKETATTKDATVHGGGGGGGGGGGSAATQDLITDDDGLPLAEDNPPRFAGIITNTLDSGGYTYAKIKRDDGKAVWTAVGAQKLSKGDFISVERSVLMHDFHSKTLGHTFERIVFGVVLETAPAAEVEAGKDRELIEL